MLAPQRYELKLRKWWSAVNLKTDCKLLSLPSACRSSNSRPACKCGTERIEDKSFNIADPSILLKRQALDQPRDFRVARSIERPVSKLLYVGVLA